MAADLDFHGPGRQQDAAAGPHHPAVRRDQAHPGPVAVLYDLDREPDRGARDREDGPQGLDSKHAVHRRAAHSRGRPIGEEGRGFEYILHGLNPERILIAAEAVGIRLRGAATRGRAASAEALAWMQLEAADLMVCKGGSLYDAGKPCGPAANTAKYLAAEAGYNACQTAVMTLGGMGYAKEYHVERLLRESYHSARIRAVLTDSKIDTGAGSWNEAGRRAAGSGLPFQPGAGRAQNAGVLGLLGLDAVDRPAHRDGVMFAGQGQRPGDGPYVGDRLAAVQEPAPLARQDDVVLHLRRAFLRDARTAVGVIMAVSPIAPAAFAPVGQVPTPRHLRNHPSPLRQPPPPRNSGGADSATSEQSDSAKSCRWNARCGPRCAPGGGVGGRRGIGQGPADHSERSCAQDAKMIVNMQGNGIKTSNHIARKESHMASITNLGSVSGLPPGKNPDGSPGRQRQGPQGLTDRGDQLPGAHQRVQPAAKRAGSGAEGRRHAGQGGDHERHQGQRHGRQRPDRDGRGRRRRPALGAWAESDAKNGATGSFEIELSDGTKRTIDLKGDTSLNGIVKAINADDKAGVRATNITVTGDQSLKDVPELQQRQRHDRDQGQGRRAEDQRLAVKSGSNNVSNVIDGVTLNLTDTTPTDKPIQLKLEADVSVATKAVQDFVKTYNALQTTIKGLTAYNPKEPDETKKASPLTGDGTTRAIQSAVSNALIGALGSGAAKSLSDLGITTDPLTRQLKLDNVKLDKALKENPADVSTLLTGKDGLAKQFDAAVKDVLGSNGSLKNRTDGLNKTITDWATNKPAPRRPATRAVRHAYPLHRAGQRLVAKMNSTGAYLTTVRRR
ncbi:hypothetical protein FQR65_LT18340 [Abscondita terminalis]|nr:hypothetical protein FQR65_LT18340 [Abscondita terminalis]